MGHTRYKRRIFIFAYLYLPYLKSKSQKTKLAAHILVIREECLLTFDLLFCAYCAAVPVSDLLPVKVNTGAFLPFDCCFL